MQAFRALLLLTLFFQAFCAYAQEKSVVFVFTDIGGDPDDEQSLVRFLHYANEFDIQGIWFQTVAYLSERFYGPSDLGHKTL